MKYRVFVEDVGPSRFSGVRDIVAATPKAAIKPFATDQGKGLWHGRRLIAFPHSRRDLWPDGQTGKVPREALTFR